MIREAYPYRKRFEGGRLRHASAAPRDPAIGLLTRTRHGLASLHMYSSKVQQPTNTDNALLATDSLSDLGLNSIRLHLA